MLIVAFSGCGPAKGPDTTKEETGAEAETSAAATKATEAQEQVTLRVWGDAQNQQVIEKPFQKINEAFMAKYPNIKVQFEISQTNDSLNVALQSNELPDCFMVQGDKNPKMAEMARNGYILPLDGKIDTGRYSPMEISYTQVDGKIYCSPSSFLDTCLVYYNKDIFSKEGLSVPKTWDDFIALNDKLLAKNIIPLSYSAATDWDNFWVVMSLAPAFANDALENITVGKGTFVDPSIAKAFNTFRSFAEKGYFGKNFVATDAQGAQLAFTNGKAAMIIDGTWNNTLYSGSEINLGHFFIPNEKGEKIAQTSLSNFMTYAVASKSAHPEEAELYVSYLASLEAQQIMEDELGMVPTLKDIKPQSESVAEMSGFDTLGWSIMKVCTICASEKSKPNDIILKEVVPKLVTSQITGEQACDILDKAATYPQKQ